MPITPTPTPPPILTEDLTTGKIEGEGVFDQVMSTMQVRLDREYTRNRIKGTEYAKVYLGQMESAMQQSILFLLGKDKITFDISLIQSQIDKTNAEIAMMSKQASLIDEEIKLAVVKTDNEIKQGVILDLQDDKLIAETANIVEQKAKIIAEAAITVKQGTILDKEGLVLDKQPAKVDAETRLIEKKISQADYEKDILEAQLAKIEAEKELIAAQIDKIEAEILRIQEEKKKTTSEVYVNNARGSGEVAKYYGSIYVPDTTGGFLSGVKSVGSLMAEQINMSKKDVEVKTQEVLNLKKEIDYKTAQISKTNADKWLAYGDYSYSTKDWVDSIDLVDYDHVYDRWTMTNKIAAVASKSTWEKVKAAADYLVASSKASSTAAQYSDTIDTYSISPTGTIVGRPNQTVTGIIGKQKTLYGKQIDGFDRDAEEKASKVMFDMWSVHTNANPDGAIPTVLDDGNLTKVVRSVLAGANITI